MHIPTTASFALHVSLATKKLAQHRINQFRRIETGRGSSRIKQQKNFFNTQKTISLYINAIIAANAAINIPTEPLILPAPLLYCSGTVVEDPPASPVSDGATPAPEPVGTGANFSGPVGYGGRLAAEDRGADGTGTTATVDSTTA